MDAPPTAAELKQEEQMQRSHDEDAVFDAGLAGIKHEGMPNDPFFGTSPADAKARRQARGAYAEEDSQPTPADPIDDYAGPRSGQEVRTMDDLSSYVAYKMALARELRPYDFDEVVYGHVIPMLRELGMDEHDPRVQEWLLTSDFCEQAYAKGLELRDQNRLPEDWEKMDGDSFGEWLSSNHGSGRRLSEDPPKKPDSRRDMKRMNKLENPEDFARALDAWKLRGD